MRDRDVKGRALAAVAALGLGIGFAATATAQTSSAPMTSTQPAPAQPAQAQQYGDSAALSSGAPITAPATVDSGQLVNVVVEGAAEGSRIELWGPVGAADGASQLAAVPLTGGVAAVTAPDRSGSYELRYIDAAGKQRGRQAFDVASVPVALTVTTPVGVGGMLDVSWQGPARPGDMLEIVSASGAVIESSPVSGNPSTANVSQITVPQEPGRYQLRYVTGDGSVLRSVDFDVR